MQASLRRAQEAIARGAGQQDEMVRAWTESLRTAYPDWGRERWQRRLERKLRRRAEREAKIANASLFEGYVWLLAAIVLFIIALSSLPFLWWLIFPAAGLGVYRDGPCRHLVEGLVDQRDHPEDLDRDGRDQRALDGQLGLVLCDRRR